MPELPSKSRLRQLGERLAANTLTESERAELENVRENWNGVLSRMTDDVNEALQVHGCVAVGRLKNLGTIAEKIDRISTSLPRMRDVIGCRVVVKDRLEQQAVVDRLLDHYGQTEKRVIDRNQDPREGYRAVHIELVCEGVRAELQIRTDLQHQWAEAMESLADIYGRPLRYGDYGPLKDLTYGQRIAAIRLIASLQRLSGRIHQYEMADAYVKEQRTLHRHRWRQIARVLRGRDWRTMARHAPRLPALAIATYYFALSARAAWSITRLQLNWSLNRTRSELARVS